MNATVAVTVARARLRRRWRGLVGLGLAAGLAGGAVAGLAGGARRGASALDRLVDATGASHDVSVTVYAHDLVDDVEAAPGVARRRIVRVAVGQVGGPAIDEGPNRYVAVVTGPPDAGPVVVRGRPPDPAAPAEVAATEYFVDQSGLDVGATFRWRALTRQEFLAFAQGAPVATGRPELDLKIVSVVRTPSDVSPSGGPGGVIGTPAFAQLLDDDALAAHQVHLTAEPGRRGALLAQLEALAAAGAGPGTGFPAADVVAVEEGYRRAREGLRVQARGLLVAAAVVALGAGLALAQAVDRGVAHGDGDDRVLAALGVDRSGRMAARALPFLPAAVVAAPLTAATALATSALTPTGSARRLEPRPGPLADGAVLLIAAVGVAAFVVAAAAASAWWRVRRAAPRPAPTRSTVADLVTAGGAPAPVAVGVRLALEPGQGASRAPTRSMLAGAVAAVVGVVAAATVATNLDRLLDTPARYGWSEDLQVLNPTPGLEEALLGDDRVGAVTRRRAARARVGDADVEALAYQPLKGDLGPTLLDGRLPRLGEVALGPRLALELGIEVGATVGVQAGDGERTRRLEVVGIALDSVTNDAAASRAAVFAPGDLEVVQRTEPFVDAMVDVTDDLGEAARRGVVEALEAQAEVVHPVPPPAVRNLEELRAVPPFVTVALVVLGGAAVAHGVATSVRRRRRDLAVLHTLGFVRRRIMVTVVTLAATTASVGLALGIPAGLALGTAVWTRIAASVDVGTDVALPWMAVAVAVAATALVALATAAAPALTAARVRAIDVLRAE